MPKGLQSWDEGRWGLILNDAPSRLRVQGLTVSWFKISLMGFRIEALGLRVQALELRVWSLTAGPINQRF